MSNIIKMPKPTTEQGIEIAEALAIADRAIAHSGPKPDSNVRAIQPDPIVPRKGPMDLAEAKDEAVRIIWSHQADTNQTDEAVKHASTPKALITVLNETILTNGLNRPLRTDLEELILLVRTLG